VGVAVGGAAVAVLAAAEGVAVVGAVSLVPAGVVPGVSWVAGAAGRGVGVGLLAGGTVVFVAAEVGSSGVGVGPVAP
jgi:hypothetical protein